MNIHRVLLPVVVILTASGVFAQDYEIRMTRPSKTGEKYELAASGSMSEQMTISAPGQDPKKNAAAFTVKLEGTVTVLTVDEMNRETKISLVISKCLMSINGNTEEKEVLPKDTKVVAQVEDGKTEYLVDGDPASKEMAKILGLLISLPTTKATDDDIFGTKERKKMGDSWAVNSAKAAEDFSVRDMKVDAENIKGTTKLEKMVVVDGAKCLQLKCTMEMNNFTPPLPDEMKVEKANMTANFSGEFPVDGSSHSPSEGMTMKISLVARGKLGPVTPDATLSMKMEQSRQAKRKYIK